MFVVETITEIAIEKALHARSSMRVPTNSSANRRLCFLTEQPTMFFFFPRLSASSFALPSSVFAPRFQLPLLAFSLFRVFTDVQLLLCFRFRLSASSLSVSLFHVFELLSRSSVSAVALSASLSSAFASRRFQLLFLCTL